MYEGKVVGVHKMYVLCTSLTGHSLTHSQTPNESTTTTTVNEVIYIQYYPIPSLPRHTETVEVLVIDTFPLSLTLPPYLDVIYNQYSTVSRR